MPSNPDALTRALIAQLVRKGMLAEDDINEIASGLDAAGDDDVAHQCRVAYIEAHAPTQSDWEAQRRRAQMTIVSPD